MDPDPGGPKTYGSGSASLLSTYVLCCVLCFRELTYALHLETTKILMSLLAPVAFTSSKPAQQMAGWTEVTGDFPIFFSIRKVKNPDEPARPGGLH
jgi:hypothetical protein